MFRYGTNIARRTFAKVLCLSIACSAISAALIAPPATGKAYARWQSQTIPIRLSAVQSGSQVTVSVTVQSVPVGGGSVYVDTSNNSLISPPTGAWPYTLNFPDGGSTTQSATFNLSPNAYGNTITIGSCETDLDPSNSANWQASTTITPVLPF